MRFLPEPLRKRCHNITQIAYELRNGSQADSDDEQTILPVTRWHAKLFYDEVKTAITRSPLPSRKHFILNWR